MHPRLLDSSGFNNFKDPGLTGWKMKTLNLAGRATLISSVTSSIPSYHMLSTLLPKATVASIEKLNKQFIWGGTEEKRGIHLVNWATVCLPKKMGGLGIRRLGLHNRALLQKTAWRFIMEPNNLWVRVLKSKYRVPDNIVEYATSHDLSKNSWSYSWRCLMKAWKELATGLVMAGRWISGMTNG